MMLETSKILRQKLGKCPRCAGPVGRCCTAQLPGGQFAFKEFEIEVNEKDGKAVLIVRAPPAWRRKASLETLPAELRLCGGIFRH